MKIRKITSALLSLAMVMSLLPAVALAADLPFTDVSKSAWYYNDVEKAYDTGLVNGTTPTTFAPDKNLTYAEAVTLASRMYQTKYEGKVTVQSAQSGNWYQSFVDYAKQNGIITKDYSWNAMATRGGYMEIFAGALKDADLFAVNTVDDGAIPDVPTSHPQAAAIYKLYRAGILQGNDEAHNCRPDNNIKRSEMSAILTRMMNPDQRVKFELKSGATDIVDDNTSAVKDLTILSQTTRVAVDEYSDAKFEVEVVGGTPPYKYEWHRYRGGEADNDIEVGYLVEKYGSTQYPYTGYDTATLTLKNVEWGSWGDLNFIRHGCTVTDATGKTVKSDEIPLMIIPHDPEIKLTIDVDSTKMKLGTENRVTATITGGDPNREAGPGWYISYDGTNFSYWDTVKFESKKGEKFTVSDKVETGSQRKITSTAAYTTSVGDKSIWLKCTFGEKGQRVESDVVKIDMPTDRTLTTNITGITPKTGTINGKSVKYIYLDNNQKIDFKFNYTATGKDAKDVITTVMAARDIDNFSSWHNANDYVFKYTATHIGPASGSRSAYFTGQTGSPVTAVRMAVKYPDGEMVYSDEILYIVSPLAVRQWTADNMSMVNIAGGVAPFTVKWESYSKSNESNGTVQTYTTSPSEKYSGRVHALTGDGISNTRSYNWLGIRQSHHEKVSDKLGNSKYVCTITDAIGNKITSYESLYGDESNKDWFYSRFWEDTWEGWYNYDIHDDEDGTNYIDTAKRWGTALADGTVVDSVEEKWQDVKNTVDTTVDNITNVVDGIGTALTKLFGL